MDDVDARLQLRPWWPTKNVGGTSGGLGSFVLGAVMTVAGGYLLLNQVTVTTASGSFYGYNAFGLSLVPLLFGILLLFYNGQRIARLAAGARRAGDHRGRHPGEPDHLLPPDQPVQHADHAGAACRWPRTDRRSLLPR